MPLRWRILLLLFLLRSLMAFQFATIGAISPLLEAHFQVDSVAIGALIGIYFSPGIVVALAGGTIAGLLGDKRIVLLGLGLMALGAALMTFVPIWEMQNTGRFIAGIGGVILNVVMSKMVMDWFDGPEIATAMTIFINSWPVGIALALIVQPTVANSTGLFTSFGLEAVMASVGFLALLLFYRSPGGSGENVKPVAHFPTGGYLVAIVAAGMVWGLFNAAIAIVFSFAPTLLVGRDYSLPQAGASTSLMMWALGVAGIFGGYLADRVRRPQLLLLGTSLFFGMTLLAIPRLDQHLMVIALVGIAAGFCVGPIMKLPAQILHADTRATGMGVFYTLYYVCFAVMPWISGNVITAYGIDRVFDFGALVAVSVVIFLGIYQVARPRNA